MKQMTNHKLMLKQIWRKISQHILMTLGTMSLLVVATGLSADLPRSPAWTFSLPPLPRYISPRLVQCEKSTLKFKELGLMDCPQSEKFHLQKDETENHP